MIKQTLSRLISLLICCSSLQYVGCSVIGFAIGASVDANSPESDSISVRQLPGLELRAKVKVIGKDVTVSGEYIGLEEIPIEEYRSSYRTWQAQERSGLFIPSLGDTIIITPVRDNGGVRQIEGQLIGFRQQFLRLKIKRSSDTAAYEGDMLISFIKDLSDGKGNMIEGKAIQAMMTANDIPLMSKMVIEQVETPAQTVRIPLDKIERIEKKVSQNAALTGFLVGAAIDVVVVAASLASLKWGTLSGLSFN